MILSNIKTVIYEIIITGKNKEEVNQVYDMYFKTDMTKTHVTKMEVCECCGNAKTYIEYNTKKAMLRAYSKVPLEKIPDSVNVSYYIDKDTINEVLKEMVKEHFNLKNNEQ